MSNAELVAHGKTRDRVSAAGPRLIIVARQDRSKGAGIVLESLPLLIHDFPAVTLDVVGDGSALPQFRARARELGIAHRVRFLGRLDHDGVVALLREADLFCFPTAAPEGFPKVVVEAMACGLPVVTTPVSVLPHLLQSGGGMLIDRPDPTALAAAIRRCLGDSERYRAMSAAAVETARQFSVERWRDAIGDALSEQWGALRSNG
jgi:glycosyltransferase involved in cell wall biosynthesis